MRKNGTVAVAEVEHTHRHRHHDGICNAALITDSGVSKQVRNVDVYSTIP